MADVRTVGHARWAVLLQAVAVLHPPGPPDETLIGALADLIVGPLPPAEPAAPPRPPPESGDMLASSALLVDGLQAGREAVGTPAAPAGARPPAPTQEQLYSSLDGAQLSTIEQTAPPAALVPPSRARTVRAHADGTAGSEAPASAPPSEGLFPLSGARAILRELAALPGNGQTPDMDLAVLRIARATPIATLPRRQVTLLGHEIALLFDAGPGMLPFTRDKQQLASVAVRVLGSDRVRIADFFDTPGRGVRARGQVRWSGLRWPGRGSAILVVGDLGIGEHGDTGAAPADEWLAFLAEAARRQVRTVALIPYLPAHWPAVARCFNAALMWDVQVGVQSLRRAIRTAGQRR